MEVVCEGRDWAGGVWEGGCGRRHDGYVCKARERVRANVMKEGTGGEMEGRRGADEVEAGVAN